MDSTKPKLFVFVLMPFSGEFRDIYEIGIKQACDETGTYCERVDEQMFDESILDRVYNQIGKADVVIADMTGRNPNVFYETGYAHALDKRVILMTQNAKDIPFDLKHYPHIVYEGSIVNLKNELVRRLQWCVENPKDSLARVDVNVDVFLDDKNLANKPELSWGTASNKRFRLKVHNIGVTTLRPESCSFAVVYPKDFHLQIEEGANYRTTTVSDTQRQIILPLPDAFFPDSWETLSFLMRNDSEFQGPTEWSIRIFTEIGPKDIPFIMLI